MSTITTINGSGVIATDRASINTNFSNLNTDKIETSYLDTDTTLADNSDSKIATQKAVKAYVDAGGNVNASETSKGIVEEATDAEVTAGTSTGATGAKLIVTPAKLATRMTAILATIPTPTAKVIIPKPLVCLDPTATTIGFMRDLSTATTMEVCLVTIPFKITVNKLSIRTGNVTGDSTVDFTLYSEDGQTRILLVTDGAIASGNDNIVKTFSVSAVEVPAGNYYLALNVVGASGAEICFWDTDNTLPFSTTEGLGEDVASEPKLIGTITISSGTPPTTIDPTAITTTNTAAVIVRLDN